MSGLHAYHRSLHPKKWDEGADPSQAIHQKPYLYGGHSADKQLYAYNGAGTLLFRLISAPFRFLAPLPLASR
jgi:hypothetical protein